MGERDSRPTGRSSISADTPDYCERCGGRFVRICYVNGEAICGVCYADKMGYLAQDHPRKAHIDPDA